MWRPLGERSGVTTSESAEIKRMKAENLRLTPRFECVAVSFARGTRLPPLCWSMILVFMDEHWPKWQPSSHHSCAAV